MCEDTPESIAQCMEDALPHSERVGANARKTLPVPWERILDMALERYQNLIDRRKFEKKKA